MQNGKRVHFIGIGGIGLSALARWFKSEGWNVSGCDAAKSQVTEDLTRDGIRVSYGHAATHVKGNDLVIVSQAIAAAHPELRAAKASKVPVVARPGALGELSRMYDTIAVAGAHGKSTTTAMAALALLKAKFDPTVIVGTKLKEFPAHNFRKGKSKWFLLEADEYGRAFLEYSPLHAIVTNIDREHLDIYKNFGAIQKAFLEFLGKVRPGGAVVLNGDDPGLFGLKPKIQRLAKEHGLRVYWYTLKDPLAKRIEKILNVPGTHNVSNAMGVYVLATKILGIPQKTVLQALSGFEGTWRRAEYRGSYELRATSYEVPKGIARRSPLAARTFSVYDDYAHHPTEIKATLKAFHEKYPKAKIVCVFQPHQAERLKRLFKEFKSAFLDADALLLFPEYRVAGRETGTRKQELGPFTARGLALAIKKKYPKQFVQYIESPARFNRVFLSKTLSPLFATNHKLPTTNCIVIMMGAGNIVDYTKKLTNG